MSTRAMYVMYWAAVIIAAAVGIMILAIGNAKAMEAPSGLWRYDVSCCNQRDCAPIDPRNVLAIRGVGYRVVLEVGDHPLVNRLVETIIPFDKAKPSGDNEYHACVQSHWENGERTSVKVRCLYITGGV